MEFSMVVQQILIAADKRKEEQERLNKLRTAQNAQKNAYNKQRKKPKVDIDDDEDDDE